MLKRINFVTKLRITKINCKNKDVIKSINLDIKEEKAIYNMSKGNHDVINKQSKVRLDSLRRIKKHIKNNKIRLTDSDEKLLYSYYQNSGVYL